MTVLPNAALGEVNIILPGLHITLTLDESTQLASGLASSLEQLQATPPREGAAAGSWDVGRSKPAAADPRSGAASTDTDTTLRTRALIQASIRDKGLSLREEQRE
jgi:hypothetical protein